jgi:hypothetical protein
VAPCPSVPSILSSILSGVLSVLRASATHVAVGRAHAWGGPWHERRERNVPRDKPFPHVQPCRERHAIVGVWLVGIRLAVDQCRARLQY